MRFSFVVFAVFSALSVVGCSDQHAAHEHEQVADPNAVYECPMHCVKPGESVPYTQRGPGHCPVCGMDLVPKATTH